MQDYRKLKVWQRAMDLTVKVYRHTGSFPKEERFGLVDQIRRAIVSVSLNIAEGCGTSTGVGLRRYLKIALGSLYESKTGLELALRLGFSEEKIVSQLLQEADEIAAMIGGLMKRTK